MPKRFHKQIGFIALLVFISHITPQSTNAMRRMTLEDYKEDERMSGKSMAKKMNEYAESCEEGMWRDLVSGVANFATAYSSAPSLQPGPIEIFSSITGATTAATKLVCKRYPRQHSIVDADGRTDSEIEMMACPDCE